MNGLIIQLKEVFRNRPLLMTGLCLLVIGLPLSLFLTSLSQFFLAGSFFLEGSPAEKTRRFFRQPLAVAIASVWLLHVIGLAWTENLVEGIHDVRIKLPLLTLPVILAGSGPLERLQYRFVLWLFVAAVACGSAISTAVFIGWIYVPMDDVRDIFIFKISHIRFALFVCLSVAICSLEALKQHGVHRWGLLTLASTLIGFLVMIESMTGIGILVATGVALGIASVFKRGGKVVGVVILLVAVSAATWLTVDISNAYLEASKEDTTPIDTTSLTAEGRKYYFDTTNTACENGHRVWAYVCDPELKREWNRRSRTPYDSDNELYQPLRTGLVRYLASKGVRKDARSLQQMTYEEIRAVEQGIANVNYLHISGFRRRMKETAWEFVQYRKGLDPNDHSFTQRLEYWRAALTIVHERPFAGVGTGDMQDAFNETYEKSGSMLRPGNRLRTHNQFLAIAVGLGIPIALYFIVLLFVVLLGDRRYRHLLLSAAWLIITISMLTEDTLETQPGATFFALVFSLLVFSRDKEEQDRQ